MKQIFLALAAVLLLAGCKTGTPENTRQVNHMVSWIATDLLMRQRPDTRPFLLDANLFVCAASENTNATPASLVAELEALPNHNPYAMMFLNGVVIAPWLAYREANDPDAQAALQGICSGVNLGLMSGRAPLRSFPHLKVGK